MTQIIIVPHPPSGDNRAKHHLVFINACARVARYPIPHLPRSKPVVDVLYQEANGVMSSLKKKFAGFIRQISNPGISLDDEEIEEAPKSPGCFIQRYLNGEAKKIQPEILYNRSFQELPVRKISLLKPSVFAAYTGPQGGLTSVNRDQRNGELYNEELDYLNEELLGKRQARLAQQEDLDEFLETPPRNSTAPVPIQRPSNSSSAGRKTSIAQDYNLVHEKNFQYMYEDSNNSNLGDDYFFKDSDNMDVAGIKNWNRPHNKAFGAAATLYERHPITREKAGEPIADSFAICARENSAILVLADGVNWGERSCLAARCAVHGCVDYLNKTFFNENTIYTIETTADIFSVLLRSMFAAHNLILQEDGFLTTLCIAFVCPLRDSDQFVVCTCNVGDSLAFVYSQEHGVRSHDIYSMRDMRDALGALGPVDGPNPELNNLTCSMTLVEETDIVFLTSDGISDNFDPVVGKFAIAKDTLAGQDSLTRRKRSVVAQNLIEETANNGTCHLPLVEAYQRHELTLLRLEDLLVNGVTIGDQPVTTAKELCEKLLDFSVKLTVAKRRILEDPDLYSDDNGFSQTEQRNRRKRLCEKLAMVPGKLDHASVVAYQVGLHVELDEAQPSPSGSPSPISIFRQETQVINKESMV
uniref:PPM-type phosphatase domain-containing protein n=1 Tax=Strigamia maritima TaxID=126957 RepID=T1J1L7_STRMM